MEKEKKLERHKNSQSLADKFGMLMESSPPVPTRPVVAEKDFADENFSDLSRQVASWTIEQRKQALGTSKELEKKRTAPALEAFLQM